MSPVHDSESRQIAGFGTCGVVVTIGFNYKRVIITITKCNKILFWCFTFNSRFRKMKIKSIAKLLHRLLVELRVYYYIQIFNKVYRDNGGSGFHRNVGNRSQHHRTTILTRSKLYFGLLIKTAKLLLNISHYLKYLSHEMSCNKQLTTYITHFSTSYILCDYVK